MSGGPWMRVAWGGGWGTGDGARRRIYKKGTKVTNMLIILTAVMRLWHVHISAFIKLSTLNMDGLLYVSYISIKLPKKLQIDPKSPILAHYPP